MTRIIPSNAIAVIIQMWPLIVGLVNRLLVEQIRDKYRAHWLMQLEQSLDLSRIEQGCAGFHQGSGRGSWTRHAVPQLVRALLVKYLFDLSYRETELKIDLDMLVKGWVGYSLFESPPDHTTLQRFEVWVLEHQPRLFFDDILRQIEAVFPDEREQLQLVDTYAMLVRGAKTSLITLIRQTSARLLAELERADPTRYEQLLAQLDLAALFGAEDEKLTAALNAQERVERLQQVAGAALRLHRLLSGLLRIPPFFKAEQEEVLAGWLHHLDKIISDETQVSYADPAQPDGVTIKERKHGHKGQYRIACVNDIMATYRDHGKGKPAELAHNAAVMATERFVWEVEVITGAAPDPTPLTLMLQNIARYHGFWPAKVVGDQIFGAGKHRAAVDQASGGQTQLIALVPDYDKRTDRFVPADFSPVEGGFGVICPGDLLSTKVSPKPEADGLSYYFTAKQCRGCPFWISLEQLQQHPDLPHCRLPDGKPNARRTVFISDYRHYTLDALEYNQTAQFKQEIKRRPIIERIIFNLTHYHGARRCKSTGLEKATFQLRLAATAFNIRQLLRLRPKIPDTAAALGG